jgi:hypothetical protein
MSIFLDWAGADVACIAEEAAAGLTKSISRFGGGVCAMANQHETKISAPKTDFAIIQAPFAALSAIREIVRK